MKNQNMGRTDKTLARAGVFFGCMEEISIWDILTYVGQFAENSKKPVCKTRFVNFF